MAHYLTLRLKIIYIFCAMAVIALSGGIALLWYTYQNDAMLVTMVEKEVVLFKTAQDMELALANQKGFVTYYFVDGEAKWLQSLGQYREVFRQSLDSASSLDLNPEQRDILERIKNQYVTYVAAKDMVIDNYRHSTEHETISLVHEHHRELFFSLLDLCRKFSQNQWNVIQKTEEKNQLRSTALRRVGFFGMALFLSLCGLLLFVLYRQILIPIRGLAIETGGSPDESRQDEVVSLKHSLEGMMKEFGDTHDALAKSRQHLVQAERMVVVGEMAAGVAHTIRNPFTSIKMRMFSLSRSLDLTDIQNEDLQVISDEIARIDRIVQNFIEFARPPKLRLKLSNVRTIIDSAITLLEYRIKEYNVELAFEPDLDLSQVLVDKDRLKEALVNLLTNACEAMDQGGRVVITETREFVPEMGNAVVISIVDNGPGIPEPIIKDITNPFFTTKEDGSGLGLSIVERIVREHGGIFFVRSGRLEGAEFIIKIPVKESAHGTDTSY
ncbi:MAG: ATP-binding protein [Desulfobacterium sp.]|jgi:signal transduction histidine kinase|nr:ATP-binding protein [Desulfobacterium sp.]